MLFDARLDVDDHEAAFVVLHHQWSLEDILHFEVHLVGGENSWDQLLVPELLDKLKILNLSASKELTDSCKVHDDTQLHP